MQGSALEARGVLVVFYGFGGHAHLPFLACGPFLLALGFLAQREGEIFQRAHLGLLFGLHLLLHIGVAFVGDNAALLRRGQAGIEPRLFGGLLTARRGENEPHDRGEDQQHQREDDHLAPLLYLLLGKLLRGLLRRRLFVTAVFLVLFHNRSCLIVRSCPPRTVFVLFQRERLLPAAALDLNFRRIPA